MPTNIAFFFGALLLPACRFERSCNNVIHWMLGVVGPVLGGTLSFRRGNKIAIIFTAAISAGQVGSRLKISGQVQVIIVDIPS